MKLSPDDIRRARSVNLIGLLVELGHKPVSHRPDHALFHSPLREDRRPSFSVSCVNGAWVWYDFGTGAHGDVIEFIQKAFALAFPEAVRKLLNEPVAPGRWSSRSGQPSDRERRRSIAQARLAYYAAKAGMTPEKEEELRHYCSAHKVPYDPHFGAVWIARGETNTPYIGFPLPGPNASFVHGLECRALREAPNACPRTTIGIKSPWILRRRDAAVLVTESILDCLAGDVLFGPAFTLVALNGIGNVRRLPECVQGLNAKLVYLALDNDPEPEKGPEAQQEAIALLTALGIHALEVRVHHQAGVKDLHKLLLQHPAPISLFHLTESGIHHQPSASASPPRRVIAHAFRHPIPQGDSMESRQVPITTFIETFSASLCASAASQLRPIFRAEHRLHAQPNLSRLKEPLWPAQADVAAATALALQRHRGALIVGEMATGKTRTSVGACLIHGSRRVLVMAPPHLLRKWEREIKRVLPAAPVHQLKSLSGVDLIARTALATPLPLFAIISRERAKLSYATKPALVLRRWKGEHGLIDLYCCPHCGAQACDGNDTPLTPETLPTKSKCRRCRSPLYDFDPNGPRRYALADYICKKHPTLFDTLVVDEVHELKGKATAQGIAFANLMRVTDRVIGLTGTLSNGRSTSLFYLLWRLIPGLKSAYSFHDESRWVDVYGIRETRTTSIEADQVVEHGTQSKRKVYVTVVERPGISPRLIPHLVDKACFLRMEDLDLALPPYEEHVETCALEGRLKEHYEQLFKAAKPLIREARKSRDGHLLSTVIQALVAYPDRCTAEERITNKFGEVKFSLPPLPARLRYPKERLLLRQVEENLNRHRRVLVFCTHTGTRDITPRLHQILKQAGFRTAVLTASVQAERREEWIEDRVKAGLDVLICNPRLVQTGLDLLDFPSLRFFESDYNILTIRQASRRSWRPGQREPVDVRPLMYAGTAQEQAWSLIASGIKASLHTEGDISSHAMAAFNQEDDITIGLIRFILDQNPQLMSAEKAFRDLARAYKEQREVIGEQSASSQPPMHRTAVPPEAEEAIAIPTADPRPPQVPKLSLQLNLFAA